MWRPQLEWFAGSGWRAIAPDLRGYGDAPRGGGKTTLDVFAGDLVALLDRLAISQAVFCGLSMGGQIVMELCRAHASRVRGIVLAATFARADTAGKQRQRIELADRLEREGMDAYARELLPTMLAARSIARLPQVAEQVLAMMRTTDAAGAAAALRGRAERPCYDDALASTRVPALVIAGSEDAYTTHDDALHLASLLADCNLLEMPGVGHMPNLEEPLAFNAALERFLSAHAEQFGS